jgi:hypothetical protein
MHWKQPGLISHDQTKVFETQQTSLIFNATDHSINVPLGIGGILRFVHCPLLRIERSSW